MEDIAAFISILIILFMLGCLVTMIVWAFSSSTFGLLESFYIMIFNKPFMPHAEFRYRSLDPGQEDVLKKYSKYYRMLPEEKKRVFSTRILKFIKLKKFITKGDLVLSDDMKTLVAESAVKLTFGLRNYKFEKFEQIYLFKGSFYSGFSKTENIGETNPRGMIVFSWRDLLAGNMDDSDNLNVGLHEFAHAYMLDNRINEDQYFEVQCELFDTFYHNKESIEKIKLKGIFRNYAFTNKMEFFAVAVEHFFETPVQFSKEIPELYSILCKMLNQDTAEFYSRHFAIGSDTDVLFGRNDREESTAPFQPD